MATTADILRAATQCLADEGFSSAREDAEIIVAAATGRTRTQLLTYPETPVPPDQQATIWRWIEKRKEHFPVQYLRGSQEFYGRDFVVTPDVLIPRPETELVVDCCLNLLSDKPAATVLDIGTGSGCIAVTLAGELPGLRITATDISETALSVAGLNALRLLEAESSIEFLAGDLAEPVRLRSRFYDLIVSNPPYIGREEMHTVCPSVSRYEPGEALFSGKTGLELHARILSELRPLLKPDGQLVLEIGFGQSSSLINLASGVGWAFVDSHNDLAGIERCLIFQLAGSGAFG